MIAPEGLPRDAQFSTDTRTLAVGDVYVALRGASLDGHAFARDALDAGARVLVVDDAAAVPQGTSALVVRDTTQAYLAFAGVARARLGARVVAVTGSAGKTTTKHALARILEIVQGGRVVATHANENNEIGVAKLFLGAPADSAFVVVEFGARHYGEITPLARVAQPEVGVLTNVGDAHLEIFGSLERLVQTKYGIFATGARAVVPFDAAERGIVGDAALRADRAAADRDARAGRPRTYFRSIERGEFAAFAPPEHGAALVALEDRHELAIVPHAGARQSFATAVSVAGTHNLRNVAAAAAAVYELGFDGEAIARALEEIDLPAGRYERIALGDAALVYDAYNASMDGMLATLASFAIEPAARRIAVLGSMAELGPDAPAMHARVGAAAARADCAYLLVGGDHAADLARGARSAGYAAARTVTFANNFEAIAWLDAHLEPGDLVLLKASRRYRLEEIVAGLRETRANDESSHA